MHALSDLLTFCLLLLEIAVLACADRRIFGRWVTPFNLLALPYFTVLVIVLIFGPLAELYPLRYASLWVWIVGLAAFWVFGSVPVYAVFRGTLHWSSRSIEGEDVKSSSLVALSICCVAASTFGLIRAGGGPDLFVLSSQEFRIAYASGWTAHVRVISYSLIMYLVGTRAYVRLRMAIVLVALLAPIAIGTSKSWLMIPVFTGLVYQVVTHRLRLTAKAAVAIAGIFFAAFCAAYLIRFLSSDAALLGDSSTYVFLARHFVAYLSSGILALSERHASGMTIYGTDWRIIFAPLVNIQSLLTGQQLVSSLTDYWIDIGSGSSSNVHTLFGTLYIHLGVIGGLLYVLLLALVVNGLYALSIIRGNAWLLLATLFQMSLLAFGWFDNYSGNLSFIEVPTWTLLLFAVSKLRIGTDGFTPGRPRGPSLPE